MSGRGMKKAQLDYYNQNVEKWGKNTKRIGSCLKEHPECYYSIDDGMCLIDKTYFKDSIKKRYQKKRKKKYKQLWNNCMPLSRYKGRILMDQSYVLDRR
jgi:hypothetical protein